MKKIKVCLYCGKKLKDKRRKFCNTNHQQNWRYHNIKKYRRRKLRNARNYYYKNKDNPEFKRKQRLRFEKWIGENREHYNDLIRPLAREYQRRKYYERKRKGLCVNCGKPRDNTTLSCNKCRKQKKEIR